MAADATGGVDSEPGTPRPLTRHFYFEALDEEEGKIRQGPAAQGDHAACGEHAENDRPVAKNGAGGTNGGRGVGFRVRAVSSNGTGELNGALSRRKAKLEEAAQTFESEPTPSTADASHLEGISEDAPDPKDWLREMPTPEEDRVSELLTKELEERGSQLPSHAPREASPEESAKLAELSAEVQEQRQRFEAERDRLSGSREELQRREAEVSRREAELKAERELHERMARALEFYPKPDWLDKPEGTMNIGVVGNSGVGKSLLINRVRGLMPGADGWAPVGVRETTTVVAMYAFPAERRVRLWDFPGAGTPMFPRDRYVAQMGLRYLDTVVIVSCGRFTETEVALINELETYQVPYFLVRTKVDIDVWNNAQDNHASSQTTLNQIVEDVQRTGLAHRPYLLSLRDPHEYDFQRFLRDLFPCIKRESMAGGDSVWDDAWAMPEVYSSLVSGIQGRWDDGDTVYLVQGLHVHLTYNSGKFGQTTLREKNGRLWWCGRLWVDAPAVRKAHANGRLRWVPADKQAGRPLVWIWRD